jgi:hypothetical protein
MWFLNPDREQMYNDTEIEINIWSVKERMNNEKKEPKYRMDEAYFMQKDQFNIYTYVNIFESQIQKLQKNTRIK